MKTITWRCPKCDHTVAQPRKIIEVMRRCPVTGKLERYVRVEESVHA